MRKDSLAAAAQAAEESGDDDLETLKLLKKFKVLKDAGLSRQPFNRSNLPKIEDLSP